jgi:hypothetical protein
MQRLPLMSWSILLGLVFSALRISLGRNGQLLARFLIGKQGGISTLLRLVSHRANTCIGDILSRASLEVTDG